MDGWNEDAFSEVLRGIDELNEVAYEIRNCRRGSLTDCTTYAEMKGHIGDIVAYLNEAMDYIVDEDEEGDPREEGGWE